jgi:hypothetical protein
MPRAEHDCAGTSGKLVLPDSEHVLPLDHIEELVLVRVHVEGSIERIYLFDDRERTRGGLRACFDQEDRAREGQALSSRRVEVIAMSARISDGANLARGDHARPAEGVERRLRQRAGISPESARPAARPSAEPPIDRDKEEPLATESQL